jgi:CubicO group peptidase (beta-lactamase class C family)
MNKAKPILKIVMPSIAVICTILFTPWLLLKMWISPLPDTIQEQVDDAIDHGLDGMIVYIDQAGKQPAFYSAGWKNRENQVPADPHALFKIASISKLYIAAATTMLVSDKKLALEDTLTGYFPELAGRIEHANRITLSMLLQHRSGIPDWIDDPEFPWTTSLKQVDEYLELVMDDPAEFDPGRRYKYSNTNYLLIGKILDRTLGYDHQQYIQSEILAPLELTHTFGSLADVDTAKLSSGYFTGYASDVKMLDVVSPGGSMIATAEDVGKFLRALNDGSLFHDDEQDIYSSVYTYEHTGEWPGYSSIARYHKDMDTVVILFVNTSGGNTWGLVNRSYKRIVQILRKEST